MATIGEITEFLEQFAPLELAADWDNVGLLVGDRAVQVTRMMTCLTVTAASATEAGEAGAQLIVTHHPLPFRPLNKLTTDLPTGRLLWQLMRAGISVYSPHTAFDSAADGINAQLASKLGLQNARPLVPHPAGLGMGRHGVLDQPKSLQEFAAITKRILGVNYVQFVGDPTALVQTVGIACGSAADLLESAVISDCDVFVTGEARFHDCLEAEAQGIALLLVGHFASERLGVEHLAEVLAGKFPEIETWASRHEHDPLKWL
jgi:dinuclear metal center YbgI/SA1388 family protein